MPTSSESHAPPKTASPRWPSWAASSSATFAQSSAATSVAIWAGSAVPSGSSWRAESRCPRRWFLTTGTLAIEVRPKCLYPLPRSIWSLQYPSPNPRLEAPSLEVEASQVGVPAM